MRTSRRTMLGTALALFTGMSLLAPDSHAINTKPMNLSDLVRESSQIVVGAVSAVHQGIGGNQLPYTEVEVTVKESILGPGGSTLTFRQFGLQTALPAVDGRRYVGLVAGMPQYKAGDEVVLFLGKTSPIGFRTTIGLGQGRFALRGGNVVNEVDNAGLFKGVDLRKKTLDDKEQHLVTTTHGVLGADTFIGFVRRAVSERWWSGSNTQKPKAAPKPGSTLPKTISVVGGTIQ